MTEYEIASLAVLLFVGLLQCGLIVWGISKLDKSDEGRDVLLTALKDQSSVLADIGAALRSQSAGI